jgi:hypothetical protein
MAYVMIVTINLAAFGIRVHEFCANLVRIKFSGYKYR